MIMPKKSNIILILIFLLLFFIVADYTLAVDCNVKDAGKEGLWKGIERCRDCGDCSLNNFVQLTVNVAQWILGVTGSLALLAFVYGGVLFLVSAGSSERVNKAKQVIIGAVIGVVIVFASYMIIGFIFQALGIDCAGNNAWSRTGWFNSCPMTQQRALDNVR